MLQSPPSVVPGSGPQTLLGGGSPSVPSPPGPRGGSLLPPSFHPHLGHVPPHPDLLTGGGVPPPGASHHPHFPPHGPPHPHMFPPGAGGPPGGHHPGMMEPPKPRFLFKVPRVVPNQKEKYESDDLLKRHSREGEVS